MERRAIIHVMRPLVIVSLLVAVLPASGDDALRDYLRAKGKPPAEYILTKLADHRVVIVGENHWFRRDAELVTSLLPELRRRGVALAMEFFRSGDQQQIDALLNAPAWDPKLANVIMRSADWPYVQYRDILHAAWRTNQIVSDAAPLRVIALGPPSDFRAQGIRYDAFMAERVIGYATDDQRRILVYCGMHHAFTRYLQVERRGRGRATEFMDRFGNILWRRLAQDVFLIALDKPEMCGAGNQPESLVCLAFGGAIECSAAAAGGAVGFDVVDSPIAELKFPSGSFYSFGHPLLRFIDYTDGYVWTEPIERLRMVDLIPLQEYAPDEANNPERVAEWKKRTDDLAHPLERPAWRQLADWRSRCR